MATKIPAGYHTVTPFLMVHDAEGLAGFLQRAFGATDLQIIRGADGKAMHVDLVIGDSKVMIGEECPQWGSKSPLALNGTPTGFMIYVPDADAAFAQAVKAGAKVEKPVQDQFWGDRTGSVIDPFGHKWLVGDRSPLKRHP